MRTILILSVFLSLATVAVAVESGALPSTSAILCRAEVSQGRTILHRAGRLPDSLRGAGRPPRRPAADGLAAGSAAIG